MKIIRSANLDVSTLDSVEQLFVYNGLDCCLTHEIDAKLELDPAAQLIYNFEFAMQAPALEMMLRGLKVDLYERDKAAAEAESKLGKIYHVLGLFSEAVCGGIVNPNSPQQLKWFFYEVMQLPVQYKYDQKSGKSKPTTERKALEKLTAYIYARPVINAILAIRDMSKLLQVLKKGIDSDARVRTSYNIGGTETGRWSSSSNAFGSGDNLQNWTDWVRRICVADHGFKFAYIDLEQAESRAVAYIANDPAYIAACESGDLHTYTCKLVWPGLPWSGDVKADRAIADRIFYRHFSHRDMSKRGGHGTNYRGKAPTMAKHLNVPTAVIENFQIAYFKVFKRIPIWHSDVAIRIQTTSFITTALGRRRGFFDRLDDDGTLRAAIAFEPQSIVGDILNLGLWKLWKLMGREIQLLAQIHDAVLFQYPERLEASILPRASKCLEVHAPVNGKVMVIPRDISVGWNWAKFDKKNPLENPDGLRSWSGTDTRTRTPKVALLDQLIF